MSPAQEKELSIRAIHEAGHAVAAHVLDCTITRISVVDDGNFAGSFGIVMPDGIDDVNKWRYGSLRKWVENYDVILMAGHEATVMEYNDSKLLYGRKRDDDAKLDVDAAESFPEPSSDSWILKMNNTSDEIAISAFLECRWRVLQESYTAWIKQRAYALVRFSPHRHAIEVIKDEILNNFERQRELEPQRAHDLIVAAFAEYDQTKGSL